MYSELQILAFESDCSARTADRCAGTASEAMARAVWKRRDIKAFVGVCEALRRRGALTASLAVELAWSLSGQRRFAEAVAVLRREGLPRAAEPAYALALAMALAGGGRIGEARAVLKDWPPAAAAELDPAFDAAMHLLRRRPTALDLAADWTRRRLPIEAALARADRTEAVRLFAVFVQRRLQLARRLLALAKDAQAALARAPEWPTAREPLQALATLGLWRQAGDGLTRLLEGPCDIDEAGLAEATDLGRQVTAFMDPEAIDRLLAAFAGRFPEGDQRRALGLTREALTGPPRLAALQSGVVEAEVGAPLGLLCAMSCAAAGRLDAAIALLGGVTGRRLEVGVFRGELADCIGREAAGRPAGGPAAPDRRRVFDLFPFNGELDMLRIKLGEMAGWVDRFVIVESRTTFTGLPKPLYFEQMRHEVAAFADRIAYVVVDGFPAHAVGPWAREFYQRDAAVAGIDDAGDDDLVLVSDVDEIIDGRFIEAFQGEFAALRLQTFRYFLNYRRIGLSKELKTAVCRAGLLRRYGSSFMRAVLTSNLKEATANGGWHFTSVGDPAAIALKMKSYSHAENLAQGGRLRDEGYYGEQLAGIRGGTMERGWARCDVDDSYPKYVQDNRTRLAHLLF